VLAGKDRIEGYAEGTVELLIYKHSDDRIEGLINFKVDVLEPESPEVLRWLSGLSGPASGKVTATRIDMVIGFGALPVSGTYDNQTMELNYQEAYEEKSTTERSLLRESYDSSLIQKIILQIKLIRRVEHVEPNMVEVYGTESNLAIRETPDIKGKVLKRVPDGWVLKNLTKQGDWCNVEDVTDGIVGWVQSEYLRTGDQEILQDRVKRVDDINLRKEVFLEAVAHYYYNDDTVSSLYSSNDKDSKGQRNELSVLRKNGFPIELILAIASVESGEYGFDNEIYDQYWAEKGVKEAGVGIMQIHGSNKGWGSKLECYAAVSTVVYKEQKWYKQRYYGNTKQGIYANVKDGLRALRWAYQDALDKGADNRTAGAVWRYNLGRTWRSKAGERYLSMVADRLEKLREYFGFLLERYRLYLKDIYGYRPLNDTEIQKWARYLRNYTTANIKSFGELRVYDIQGRVTGLINGEAMVQVPNSDYYEDNVILFSPRNFYKYVIAGIGEGLYNLTVVSVMGVETISFVSQEIPISKNVIHQYTVD